MVEEDHVAFGDEVVDRVLMVRQMIESDGQPLHDIVGSSSANVLGRNVFVEDIRGQTTLEPRPIHLAERIPQPFNGLSVSFDGH